MTTDLTDGLTSVKLGVGQREGSACTKNMGFSSMLCFIKDDLLKSAERQADCGGKGGQGVTGVQYTPAPY